MNASRTGTVATTLATFGPPSSKSVTAVIKRPPSAFSTAALTFNPSATSSLPNIHSEGSMNRNFLSSRAGRDAVPFFAPGAFAAARIASRRRPASATTAAPFASPPFSSHQASISAQPSPRPACVACHANFATKGLTSTSESVTTTRSASAGSETRRLSARSGARSHSGYMNCAGVVFAASTSESGGSSVYSRSPRALNGVHANRSKA
jgi:hypothetical protein